jgi:predicted nucleic acid-binding protein
VGFGDAGLILDTNALSAAAEEHPGVMRILGGAQQLALRVVVIGNFAMESLNRDTKLDTNAGCRDRHFDMVSGIQRLDW